MKHTVQHLLVAIALGTSMPSVNAADSTSNNSNAEINLPYQAQLVDHQQRPIANARIKVRNNDATSRTDQQGNFSLNLPAGRYTIDIEAGSRDHFHQTISVTGDSQRVQLHLDANHQRKIVITANPLEHTKLDMATPAIVLSGDELIMKRSSTIGDMLQLQPGMSVSSFGPAVSRPVIRGLSGGRVLMTSNQMTVQDASTNSADHDVSLEPLLADQIEVLKGPSTLLYGSGAIGGVVNVTDKRINPEGADGVSGGVELRLGDSATSEESIVATLNGGNSSFAWHIDAFSSDYGDLEIPGFAESEYLHEAEGHEEEHEGEEHEGEEHEEHEEEAFGVLENSRSESTGGSFGATWNGEWGYFGVSVNAIDKFYGVPGHAHHEEEHEEGEGEEEHGEEGVFIDLEQTRWDIQSEFNNPVSGIDSWFIGWSMTDYQHVELEGDEQGTVFENEATELRSYMKHRAMNDWEGIFGVQLTQRDFSAIGEEAFVPPSDSNMRAFFVVEEKRFGDYKIELGARLGYQSIKVNEFGEESFDTLSYSAGSVYDLTDSQKLAINLAHAERAPTVEELYSFGEHAATQTFERGNPNLDKEVSHNLDVSWRFNGNTWSGEINAYWNKFHDFIFGQYRENTGFVTDLNGQSVAIEEDLPIIFYAQDNASIRGIEIQADTMIVDNDVFGLKLGLMADFIEAEFEDGAYVPRIPPLKYGFNLQFSQNAFTADLSWTHYADQTHIGQGELPTDGFNILDLELGYRIVNDNHDAMIFLRGKNLLDEEARDHASFLKDLAPRAGQNFVAGLRYQF
ncbi:TonB-dependent receptor domain-containing protein [Pleionea mediterranea]|uniref:Iron complex outermembrane receptor protein n=1 Tax=Pleionea mediterranea TaxID=523701 RepID=A0A316FWQ3_9GAMM|nr:TonB-dependent receptor [Pleionea mediterranea]PWK52979.1 iron complex outermembrane receptor protein [Pleionea mediterranea]